MVVGAPKQENLSGSGAGNDIRIAVVIYVHNMRTESDASPARDTAVLFTFLEFNAGCQLRR